MDQVLVLLLVGVFALAKWLIENRGGTEEPPDEERSGAEQHKPQTSAAPDSEEERLRRFMEALGLPPGSEPPSRPRPRVETRPHFEPAPKPPRPTEARPKRRQIPVQLPKKPERRQIAPPSRPIAPQEALPEVLSTGTSAPAMEVSSIPELTFASPESYVQEPESMGAAALDVAKAAQRPAAGGRVPRRVQLRDPAALRQAVILREILGPPKSLQSGRTPSIFSPL